MLPTRVSPGRGHSLFLLENVTMPRKIPLTQGKFALVDDADYHWLNQWKWCAHRDRRTYYAVRNTARGANVKRTTIRMHRLLLGAQPGQECDHINGDGLDNRRANLRFCTTAENQCNQRHLRRGKSSRFLGVCWHKLNKRWVARIEFNGQRHRLGYFHSEIAAARAYNLAALKYHKAFASLNEIPDSSPECAQPPLPPILASQRIGGVLC